MGGRVDTIKNKTLTGKPDINLNFLQDDWRLINEHILEKNNMAPMCCRIKQVILAKNVLNVMFVRSNLRVPTS
jgi:hypothetical protein